MSQRIVWIVFFICSNIYSLDKEIIVVIPSFNNALFYQRNLDSVFNQSYKPARVIYINDNSSDATFYLILKYMYDHNLENRLEIINNESRKGALANLYNTIQQLPDNAIIVLLDGDDWLFDADVLARINNYYQDPWVWITYGSYQIFPDLTRSGKGAIAQEIIINNSFREAIWVASHLRTFYAKLFKLIAKEDLLFEKDFFQVTWDMACMFPMLEMAGVHSKYIPEIMYIYNQANPINDYKVRLENVLKMELVIRNKKKYQPLKSLF